MYVASEAIRLMQKNHEFKFTPQENAELTTYRGKVDKATKFIPGWVKVAVALALGMGTMVGWKRIVVTVGEKIGKEHLTYAQGACAELVAMGTIFAADNFGLPVSTTHVLELGRRRNDGRKQKRIAACHDPQHRGGVGIHIAGGGVAFGNTVLGVPPADALTSRCHQNGCCVRASGEAGRLFISVRRSGVDRWVKRDICRIRYHTEW